MPFISCFPVHTHMCIYTVWTAQAAITQLLLVLVCFLMKAPVLPVQHSVVQSMQHMLCKVSILIAKLKFRQSTSLKVKVHSEKFSN